MLVVKLVVVVVKLMFVVVVLVVEVVLVLLVSETQKQLRKCRPRVFPMSTFK